MATLSTGADSEGGERFGACEYNDIKNHWRTSNPCANLANIQPGMIVSDEDDDRLYVASLVSDCAYSEILQACVPLSDDLAHYYGHNFNVGIYYDEAGTDELMIEAQNRADTEGITINLIEENQEFRIRANGTLAFEFLPFSATGPLATCHDVDQDSELVWGWWADDIGLLTVPANPLRENMLINSQIGVWSQSDDNKGIAELVFDNGTVAPVVGEAINGVSGTGKVMYYTLSGGGWGTNDAAGSVFLGAVTGAYEDNETIAGSVAASFDVNGDLDIGVKNDPCNDNSVASWTLEGAGIVLAFVAAEYSVTTTAINQRAWIANAPLLAGHIYKIELDINDGTAAGVDIEGYFDDGAAQYGRIETTAAGWASVSWVFECATDDANGDVGFRIPANLAGGNIQVRRFSCYEITPCCTAADTKALDEWYKHDSIDIYRQHWDATYAKDGSFYSLKMVPTEAIMDSYVRFPGVFYDNEEWYAQFQGRTVALGAWIYTSANNHCRIRIIDSVGNESSDWHPGDGAWHWLEVVRTIDAAAVSLEFRITAEGAAEVDGDSIIYVSQPMLVFGSSIGEGNYRPRQQEVIYLEKYITSNLLDNTTGWSDVAFTNLNIEADSDARLPKGVKGVYAISDVRDSGSAGANAYLQFRRDNLQPYQYTNSVWGLTNNAYRYYTGWQYCNEDGDIEYRIEATGAGTFDIYIIYYLGVQVN